ncbi:alpha/beta hydrolase [Glutamicibacter sp. MNS18]|uniref:alpha/beta fold hydrolase n=1 Tax=Glutamicibacter sp. MNS18 TaxID=2989817 RepID=UPI0022361263|nr:alpha/beta hydrolase [Glutamicibacter sp. MNS18]MCW4467192.1 alpha/beta hydrolase [Glutamicibacter sp. MNS18]
MTNNLLPVKVDRGEGTPVVLLHGLGNNHSSWEFVLEHLDYSNARVIAVDLLGFGDAPKPDVDYTLKDHSSAVAATLNELGITKAVVAGHSMGSNVALDLATRHPELVDRLVLLGAPLYRREPRGGRTRSLLRAEGLYFSLFELVSRSPEPIQAGGELAEEYVPFVKGMEITEETWPAYRKSLQYSIMQYESYQQAVQLKIPALFVNGILDFFIIRRNTTRVRLANRKLVRLKRTRGPHELTPTQGEVVARIINQVAAQVAARQQRRR